MFSKNNGNGSTYSKEKAEKYVNIDEDFTSCTVNPEVKYKYLDGKVTEEIEYIKYYVYQMSSNERTGQNPIAVKILTSKEEKMPLGAVVYFQDLEACNVLRDKDNKKFGYITYFRAKSFDIKK